MIDSSDDNIHTESRVGIYEIPCLDCNKNILVKLLVIPNNKFTSSEKILKEQT